MALDIDSSLESYTKDSHNNVVRALKTLSREGFFKVLVCSNNESLVASFHNDAESLAKQIIEAQNINRILLSLDEAADRLEERKV